MPQEKSDNSILSNFVGLVDRHTLPAISSLENVAPLSSIFCLNNPFILLFFLHPLFYHLISYFVTNGKTFCCCCFLLIKYLPYHKKYKSKFEIKTCFSSMTKQALERKVCNLQLSPTIYVSDEISQGRQLLCSLYSPFAGF